MFWYQHSSGVSIFLVPAFLWCQHCSVEVVVAVVVVDVTEPTSRRSGGNSGVEVIGVVNGIDMAVSVDTLTVRRAVEAEAVTVTVDVGIG